MDISQAITKRLIELCVAQNLTINGLSNQSGVTQSTVSDIVNGVTHNPGAATIQKLCDGLGISIRTFFDSDLFNELEQEVK